MRSFDGINSKWSSFAQTTSRLCDQAFPVLEGFVFQASLHFWYSKLLFIFWPCKMKGLLSLLGLFALAMTVVADEAAFKNITLEYKVQLRRQLSNNTSGCTGYKVGVRREWFEPVSRLPRCTILTFSGVPCPDAKDWTTSAP